MSNPVYEWTPAWSERDRDDKGTGLGRGVRKEGWVTGLGLRSFENLVARDTRQSQRSVFSKEV